jgi:hypothetical protein
VESDNYRGTGDERLQLWREVFNGRVMPFNLSTDDDTRPVNIENPIREIVIDLSHILFKPNVFITTHVLRSYTKGSVLKNLFGLPPMVKKATFHKNEIFHSLLTTLFEVIGGVDLAVLDGSSYHHGFSGLHVPADLLIVGRDAVAVETVGYALMGQKIEKLKTIQAFVEKGLGEGSMDSIDVVGASFDDMKDRMKDAVKKANAIQRRGPKRWSAAQSINSLIKDGFFKKKRSQEEVIKILIKTDTRAEDRESSIVATLRRRVKSGILEREKQPTGWIYWKD